MKRVSLVFKSGFAHICFVIRLFKVDVFKYCEAKAERSHKVTNVSQPKLANIS